MAIAGRGFSGATNYNAAEGADSSANEVLFLTGAEDSELYRHYVLHAAKPGA